MQHIGTKGHCVAWREDEEAGNGVFQTSAFRFRNFVASRKYSTTSTQKREPIDPSHL